MLSQVCICSVGDQAGLLSYSQVTSKIACNTFSGHLHMLYAHALHSGQDERPITHFLGF